MINVLPTGSRRHGYHIIFFQAEDGIRARNVTGVQTCALPISNFTFLAEFAEEGNQRDKGIMYLDKTRDSYQINLESQKIISDGKAVWSILPEDKEVQITNPVSDEESIGPNNIFTFYQKGYKYITMEDEFTQDNKRLKVIELSTENTQKNYFKIKLRINDNLHIHDVKIFDKSGARYTYTISNLYVNHKINRKKFTFQK